MDKEFWTSKKVRSEFIDFFIKKKQHSFVKSNSVIPYDDKTLLFTNSGYFIHNIKNEPIQAYFFR
jgi:alanyl-tRNA synthetase